MTKKEKTPKNDLGFLSQPQTYYTLFFIGLLGLCFANTLPPIVIVYAKVDIILGLVGYLIFVKKADKK